MWLRGFSTMDDRKAALERFYYGPVWKAHRAAANATMIDSDDVLLLRPVDRSSGRAANRASSRSRSAPATPLPRADDRPAAHRAGREHVPRVAGPHRRRRHGLALPRPRAAAAGRGGPGDPAAPPRTDRTIPAAVTYGRGMDAIDVVAAFNDRINARDLDGLTALMTDDHTFVDDAGAAINGRQACADAWAGFFAAFPDYRNVFETMTADGETVRVTGHSVCAEPSWPGRPGGPPTVREGKVSRWQVTGA